MYSIAMLLAFTASGRINPSLPAGLPGHEWSTAALEALTHTKTDIQAVAAGLDHHPACSLRVVMSIGFPPLDITAHNIL
jgi:hypothetical protein